MSGGLWFRKAAETVAPASPRRQVGAYAPMRARPGDARVGGERTIAATWSSSMKTAERLSLLPSSPGTARHINVHRYGGTGRSPKVYVQAALHANELPAMLV